MNRKFDRRFWWRHALLPLLLLAVGVAVFEFTDLDLHFSDPFYDAIQRIWPAKHSWWAETLIHRRGRDLVLVTGLGALLGWVASFFSLRLQPRRRAFLFFALSIGLCTGAVALGKELTNRHCPWDYQRYGGEVPYTRLFEDSPQACTDQGNCFPAGHAAGGFAMMNGYFLFYGYRRRAALTALLAGLGLGSLFAYGQLARGAHFVSHNLWSAAICWYIGLSLYVWVFRGRLESGVADDSS
ncbi:MAG: hypothetical protein PWP34_1786 [Desulfuromonadales bacterium]|jgi:membrane-associated PAP2 superfamily phosphatase|nr:hypothetical protein [Desulfuromonadales bacterium]